MARGRDSSASLRLRRGGGVLPDARGARAGLPPREPPAHHPRGAARRAPSRGRSRSPPRRTRRSGSRCSPRARTCSAFARSRTGLFEVQDEGSQLLGLLVGARPGETVLDYCAGAGGKALLLAGEVGPAGKGARPRRRPRAARAAAHTAPRRRAPRTCASPTRRSLRTLLADRVLVDAPCSELGTLRRGPDLRFRIDPATFPALERLQAELLASAARHVKPGGTLVYATCTFRAEENDGHRARPSSARHPEFERALPELPLARRELPAGRGLRRAPAPAPAPTRSTPRSTDAARGDASSRARGRCSSRSTSATRSSESASLEARSVRALVEVQRGHEQASGDRPGHRARRALRERLDVPAAVPRADRRAAAFLPAGSARSVIATASARWRRSPGTASFRSSNLQLSDSSCSWKVRTSGLSRAASQSSEYGEGEVLVRRRPSSVAAEQLAGALVMPGRLVVVGAPVAQPEEPEHRDRVDPEGDRQPAHHPRPPDDRGKERGVGLRFFGEGGHVGHCPAFYGEFEGRSAMKPGVIFSPPPRLERGARVAVIAPAGPFDLPSFEKGLALLRSRYEVSFHEGIRAQHRYLAGPDPRRLEELRSALLDPDTRAVFCARGGYGTMRLLPGIDWAALPPKWLVGFSDITALHCAAPARTAGSASTGRCSPSSAGSPRTRSSGSSRCSSRPDPRRAVQGRETFVSGRAEGPAARREPLGPHPAARHAVPARPARRGAAARGRRRAPLPPRPDVDPPAARGRVRAGEGDRARRLHRLRGEGRELLERRGPRASSPRAPGLPCAAGFEIGHGEVNLAVPLGVPGPPRRRRADAHLPRGSLGVSALQELLVDGRGAGHLPERARRGRLAATRCSSRAARAPPRTRSSTSPRSPR